MADYKDFENASLDLYVNQGSDFKRPVKLTNFDGTPLDLTGYTLSLTIKKYYNVSQTYTGSVDVDGDPVLGNIIINIPKGTTSLFTGSRYVYIVRINNSTDTVRVLDGQILIDRF